MGQILARGPGVFGGYLNLDDKTREAFTDDGWYRTGDLGYCDEDGYLHVTGRVSTLLVTSGGENIQPDALEERYQRHRAIAESGVLMDEDDLVGVVVPDRGVDLDNARDVIGQAIDEISKGHGPVTSTLSGQGRAVSIHGAFEAMPRGQRLPRRHPIKLYFGEAVDTGTLQQNGEGDTDTKRLVDGLHEYIRAYHESST